MSVEDISLKLLILTNIVQQDNFHYVLSDIVIDPVETEFREQKTPKA